MVRVVQFLKHNVDPKATDKRNIVEPLLTMAKVINFVENALIL